MPERNFDLLGDPIPEGRGEPGRTGHIATRENISRVRQLLVAGLTKARIAEELGITSPTLNKHYFASGKINTRQAREMAIAESRAKIMLQLGREADSGNVSAMKTLLKEIDRAQLGLLDRDASQGTTNGKTARTPRAAAVRPLGKKEADRQLALQAEDELEERYGSGAMH